MSDVVIVGGGVIGAACALELTERGASVTLVERDHLAAHASGRNQGLWVLPEDESNLPMAQASLARYLKIAPDAPIDVGLDREPVGMVLVANNRQEFQAAKAAVAMARAHDVTVDELETPIAIRDTEPALTRNLAGCWLVHHGHRMDPGALTVAMAMAAAERGASIRHHLHARALATRDDTVRGVVTDDGIIEADTTIVAGGPWSQALLDPVGVHLPIVGARGWIARLEPDPDLLTHLIESPGQHAALREDEANLRPTATEVATDGFPDSAIATVRAPGSMRWPWWTSQQPARLRVSAGSASRIAIGVSSSSTVTPWARAMATAAFAAWNSRRSLATRTMPTGSGSKPTSMGASGAISR